jgi:NAD(P)H dehydrogenase (quinone)
MFAITGITGQVGGGLARELLAAKRPVRAVLRDAAKAAAWAAQGCEIALASFDDAAALTAAFTGVEAVFVLLPPVFDPTPGFAESRRNIAALVAALQAARVPRIVCLSTIGAQATQENLLTQLLLMEQALDALPVPITFLRAAWFMENVAGDIEGARASGVLPAFLQPADKPVPMVATADVAHAAAGLLQEPPERRRIVELEGPARVTPAELAMALGRALGRDVSARVVPRASWEALFRSQGMRHPLPRMRMLDGFNEGWIEFEGGAAASMKGGTSLQAVVDALVRQRPA